jgi:hypothetical protein
VLINTEEEKILYCGLSNPGKTKSQARVSISRMAAKWWRVRRRKENQTRRAGQIEQLSSLFPYGIP